MLEDNQLVLEDNQLVESQEPLKTPPPELISLLPTLQRSEAGVIEGLGLLFGAAGTGLAGLAALNPFTGLTLGIYAGWGIATYAILDHRRTARKLEEAARECQEKVVKVQQLKHSVGHLFQEKAQLKIENIEKDQKISILEKEKLILEKQVKEVNGIFRAFAPELRDHLLGSQVLVSASSTAPAPKEAVTEQAVLAPRPGPA